jgi:hypothetical protein
LATAKKKEDELKKNTDIIHEQTKRGGGGKSIERQEKRTKEETEFGHSGRKEDDDYGKGDVICNGTNCKKTFKTMEDGDGRI